FNVRRISLFGQDTWAVAPGLEVMFGAQYHAVWLPESNWNESLAWDSLGATGADSISRATSWGTRVGFVWDVAERNRSFVRGSLGLFFEEVDPVVLHEALTGDGRALTRASRSNLDGWPSSPGSALTVPSVSLLGPEALELPRTARGSFGLLPIEPAGTDQFGRPVFGQLQKMGGLVVPRLTLNRRFADLGRVYAINGDGWSQYVGGTFALERRGAPLDLSVSYTYSQTEDNLIGARDGLPSARLDPNLDGEGGEPWGEGISDFDVPHRVVASVGLHLPVLEGGVLSGVFRFRSGYPFTPGFRPGVDPNGDGSGSNDPAFLGGVDLAGLEASWDCLTGQPSGPVERNSCRGDPVHGLDLSLRLGIVRVGGAVAELTVDAVNLIEPEVGIRDRALYLVDSSQPLSTVAGDVTIPLTANPGFGEFLRRLDPGRYVRVGVRIGR
ncbi:MAG: hypothetical protein P8Y29_12205, partial [Gemmatimonadota bacterium]